MYIQQYRTPTLLQRQDNRKSQRLKFTEQKKRISGAVLFVLKIVQNAPFI